MDFPHPLAAATGHRLEQHGQSVLINKCLEFGDVLERLDHSGDQWNSGIDSEFAALGLGTHEADSGGRRSDPRQTSGLDPFSKLGILCEKTIARVDEVGAARFGGREQAINVEVAF